MAFKVTTPGRVMLADMLPPDMRDQVEIPMDKKQLKSFFTKLAVFHPDEYIDVMKRMTDVAADVSTEYGRWTSVSMKDLHLPPVVEAYRNKILEKIHTITQDPHLTPKDKGDRIVAEMRSHIEPVRKMLVEEGAKSGNSFAISAKHGFRGNPTQLAQMLFGDMLMTDNKDRAIPIPMLNGYAAGLTPLETFAGSYGSRKAYSKVQFATADTGYFAKQVNLLAMGQQVLADDCGTTNGIPAAPDAQEAWGRVLAQDSGSLKSGTLLTPDSLKKFKGSEVIVRSPLTCKLPRGVCRKCAGLRPDGKWPRMKAYIGSESSRVTTEPLTQSLALSAKHLGTAANVKSMDPEGFDEINQFLQIPESFKGAVHSETEGTVHTVEKAPQGGFTIKVGEDQYHLAEGRNPVVKPGDFVSEGDTLSDGTANPALVAQYRGVGAGRKYFAEKLAEILERNGVPGHRSNIDIISRAFINNVRVTAPDGVAGYNYGEVVPYDQMQSTWEPRKDSKLVAPRAGKGMYLEAPALHYTVGTRLTPAVVNSLQERGVKEVTAHADDPGFQPYITRAAARSLDEPDWKARLSGFYLGKAYGDMATKGATDSPGGRSGVFAGLMDPNRLENVGD